MPPLMNMPTDDRVARLTHGFFDDFQGFLTAQSGANYTVVTAVDGTVLITDAAGGVVTIANGTATIGDNEDCYLAREPEAFLLATGKNLRFMASVKFTQVSTNTVNMIAGLTDGVAANLLQSDGAGPKASGQTICFYTKDGSTSLFIYVYNNSAVLNVELTAANSLDKTAHLGASTSFRELRFEVIVKSSTKADIIFYDDLVPVYKFTDFLYTAATPTEMQAVVGVKGGTAAAASVDVDYLGCRQIR